MREDTKEVGVVAEEEVREEGGGRARPMRDRHRKEVEERGQLQKSAAPPYAYLTEGTEEVGAAAEEEEVWEEGEGHARRTRGQSQRCRWSEVMRRSIFVIFAPPDGQRGGEGRWGW